MKDLLLGKKILIVLKYSGLAPFDMSLIFKTNKFFCFYSAFVVAGISLFQIALFDLNYLFVEDPSLTTFFVTFSTNGFNLVVVLTLILRLVNMHGICSSINNIIKIKERFICLLDKKIAEDKVWVACVSFTCILISTIVFLISDISMGLNVVYVSAGLISDCLLYYLICSDFFYIVMLLNVLNLFKALNEAILFVTKIHREGCSNEKLVDFIGKIYGGISYLQIECNHLLNITDDINQYFSKTNFLSLSFSLIGFVTSLFCPITLHKVLDVKSATPMFYYGIIFSTKAILLLYFSRITMLEVI